MVSRRKLRQQTERNSQAAQSSLANFKPAAPATPSYPNLGTRIGQQPQGLSFSERSEMRTKLNNTNGKKMIQETNANLEDSQVDLLAHLIMHLRQLDGKDCNNLNGMVNCMEHN